MSDFALISYPLSTQYRRDFEAAVGGAPTYLWLAELRRMPPLKMVKMLRSLGGDRLFIPLQDDAARTFVPVASSLAAIADIKEVVLVDPKLNLERVPRSQALGAIWSAIAATAGGAITLHRCRREMERLAVTSRRPLPPPARGPVLYLRTNMSFGVKAGGSVGHIAGVVNGLVNHGYPVEYASIEPPVMTVDEVRYHPISPLAAYGWPYEFNLYRFHVHCAAEARALAAQRRYAFLYQRMSVANYTGAVVAHETGIPLVLEYNGSEAWLSANWGVKFLLGGLAEKTELVSLRHAHVVVTVSQVLKDELVSRGVDPDRVALYPNCIDPTVFDPARFTREQALRLRARHGIPADATLASFIGTFGQWHGADVLAQAIRKLAAEQRAWLEARKVHFALVGDGLLMPKVKEILADPRCHGLFTLTGLVPQAEAPAYLAAADLLLSPHVPNADGSRFFGSPTKLFEYMAMGKAIVASELEQIGEILNPGARVSDGLGADRLPDGALAVLCRPGDIDELISGIRFVVDHAGHRSSLGQRAREVALSKYTWDHHVKEILDRVARI